MVENYEGMTWNDLVRKYFPDISDKMVEFILWERTAFPLVSVEHVEKQIQEENLIACAWRKNNWAAEGYEY